MKRVLSWIVLAICLFISTKIIQLIVYWALVFASRLYESSRGIFWVILLCGGSFGLGLAYLFSTAISTLCIAISEKICPSAKGTRYTVAAIIVGGLFLLDLGACFFVDLTGLALAIQIVIDIFAIVMSVFLFALGRDKVK